MIVHVHATYCHLIFFINVDLNKNARNVLFFVKRYAVREDKNGGTQYARPKKGGTQYARGFHPHGNELRY